jgi:pimeloyl-ACP methyl ester carboxylesterase
MSPRPVNLNYLLCGAFHRLALTAWGDPHAQPVMCVHGLSRNGRDFDELARALQDRYYVICPDMPGRGQSAWLADPALYAAPSYLVALSHLLAFIDRKVLWVGTSMGGLLGMLLAAMPGNPIQRMVLNDIGPFIPAAAIARIQSYIGTLPNFAGLAEADAYLRDVHAPFGTLTDAQWRHMAEHSTRALPGGRLALHYDPGLTIPLLAAPAQETDMWAVWERIDIPMLTLRGAESDLLLADTFARMAGKSALHTVPACGHAPALMDAASIGVVREFLDAGKIG